MKEERLAPPPRPANAQKQQSRPFLRKLRSVAQRVARGAAVPASRKVLCRAVRTPPIESAPCTGNDETT